MRAGDIENYLSQLGQELLKQGIEEPIHLERYILPKARNDNAEIIATTLDVLFGKEV